MFANTDKKMTFYIHLLYIFDEKLFCSCAYELLPVLLRAFHVPNHSGKSEKKIDVNIIIESSKYIEIHLYPKCCLPLDEMKNGKTKHFA